MAKRYLTAAKVEVGATLPWNIFNEDGLLLLKAGEEITSELQAYRLATQGLYFDTEHGTADMGQAEREPPSVVRTLNLARKLLSQVLPTLKENGGAEARINAISQLVMEAVELNADVAIASILLRDDEGSYVIRHSIDVAIVALLIGKVMQQSVEDQLTMVSAALTQNIGMLKYQDLLNNQRGKLCEQELILVRQHPAQGVNILKAAGVTNERWLEYVMCHHECEDGSGYPNGKKADELPLAAKLIAFADRYCARLVEKKYARQKLPSLALRDVLLSHGEQPPTLLAAHFIKNVGIHPPGTVVRLKSWEIGVVTKKGASPNDAFVHITIAQSGMPMHQTMVRNTELPEYAIKGELHKEDAGGHLVMSRFWGAVAAL